MADAGISGANTALELEGKRNPVIGRERDQLLPPEVEHRRFHAVGRSEPGMLVDRGEPGVVARLDERFFRGRLVERPDIGETLSSFRDHPHSHAGRLRGLELLDGALEDPDRCLPAVGDIDLDLFVSRSLLEDPSCQAEEIRHLRYRRS